MGFGGLGLLLLLRPPWFFEGFGWLGLCIFSLRGFQGGVGVEGWPTSFGLLSDVGALAVFTWLEDQNLSSETAGTVKREAFT